MMCASTRASKSTSNPFVFGWVDASASRALGAWDTERGCSSERGR